GDPPLEVINVTDIQVSGSTATAVADLAFGLQLERTLDRLVNEGGVWKIDSSEELPPPTAPGAVTVDMDLDEYSFIYDKSAVASGNFVFDVENVGEEFHEIILVSIAEGIDFQEALQSAE